MAARGALFVALLLTVSGILAAGSVLLGFEQESQRRQRQSIEELAQFSAHHAGVWLSLRDYEAVRAHAQRLSSAPGVISVIIRDGSGRVFSPSGRALSAPQAEAISRVSRTGRAEEARLADDSLRVIRPINVQGQPIGVLAVTLRADAFRYDLVHTLTPFFIFLVGMTLVTTPFGIWIMSKKLEPLDTLIAFAEKVAAEGVTEPITLKTGDEFETLAQAFNSMLARQDASMRKIQRIAFVDPITQLPNQDRFLRELNYFILQAAQNQLMGAVCLFEFDRLPRILQTLDQDQSRDLIKTTADRLMSAARTVDRVIRLNAASEKPAIVARLNGASFAVLVPGLTSPADAARFAQHLNAALNQPLEWRGHRIVLGSMCGVALAPRDGKDADAVMRQAHLAQGAARGAPAQVKIFTPALDREAGARLNLEREMRAALERNEFRAFFQPKVNLLTGRVEAAEALARWVRPDRTIISPGRFIPVAEESGLIGLVSDAILREACWKAAAWGRAGYPISVAVNLSTLQFRDEKFADQVFRVLDHAGLPPSRLELEITESVAMEDPERALSLIQPLRAKGVRFAIDDFGCGHSSLSALSKLPFDVIKIDQQFIRAYSKGDPQAAAIIEMILALASTLGMDVVAEGIEKPEEAAFVTSRGCVWGQGFLYGAAEPPGDFAELLRKQAGEPVVAVRTA